MAYGDRQSSKDIDMSSLGGGSISGACATTTYLYFLHYVDARNKVIRCYNASTRAAVTTRDTSLAWLLPHGLVAVGSTIWVLDAWTNYARAYTEPGTAGALTRDSTKDINLGLLSWGGCATDGTTLWFINSGADQARGWTASSQARDTTKDFVISSTGLTSSPEAFKGGTGDGTTLWFVNDNAVSGGNIPSNQVDGTRKKYLSAWTASSREKDPNKSIVINGTGVYGSCVYSNDTIWVGESQTETAVAYDASTASAPTGPAPTEPTADEYKVYIGR